MNCRPYLAVGQPRWTSGLCFGAGRRLGASVKEGAGVPRSDQNAYFRLFNRQSITAPHQSRAVKPTFHIGTASHAKSSYGKAKVQPTKMEEHAPLSLKLHKLHPTAPHYIVSYIGYTGDSTSLWRTKNIAIMHLWRPTTGKHSLQLTRVTTCSDKKRAIR